MENSSLISILVPIYNVEKYLRRCIDSVLAQDWNDYELILVNDGSLDGCPAICDEYSKQHSNLKVIHKKNGGLPSARLAGFKEARGEFLVFLDSDDWLLPGALRMLHDYISQGYDMVKCRPCRSDGNKFWYESYPINTGIIAGSLIYAEAMNYNQIHPYLHSGIYRKDLFSEKIFQPIVEAGISFGEDWFANMLIARNVQKVLLVEESSHAYFVNQESIVGSSIISEKINKKADFALWQPLKEWNEEVYEMALSKQYIGKVYNFFKPELPFLKRDYKVAHSYFQTHPNIRKYTDPKFLRFFECYPLFYLYAHVYRFLYKWMRLKGKMRKQV